MKLQLEDIDIVIDTEDIRMVSSPSSLSNLRSFYIVLAGVKEPVEIVLVDDEKRVDELYNRLMRYWSNNEEIVII